MSDGYSEQERGPRLGQKRICVNCQRETIETLQDGRCGQCIDPEGWERRMRAKNAEAGARANEQLPDKVVPVLRRYQRDYEDRASYTKSPAMKASLLKAARTFNEEADRLEAEAQKKGAA